MRRNQDAREQTMEMMTMTTMTISRQMKALFIGMMLFVCGVAVSTHAQPVRQIQDPSDKYAYALRLIEEGDQSAKMSDLALARAKYTKAQAVLEKFHADNPDWRPEVVEARLRGCAERLAALHSQEAQAATVTARSSSAPAATSETRPIQPPGTAALENRDFAIKPTPVVPAPSAKTAPAPAAKAIPPEQDSTIAESLNGLVFVKSYNQIEATGVQGVSGLAIRDIPLLEGPAFEQVVAPYLGRPFKKSSFQMLARDIVLYCRSKKHPVVQVILPEQEVKNGVVQIWLLEAKVGEVAVQNDGKKWFSDKSILKEVHIQPGQTIDVSQLNNDLEWLNRNPFRQVNAEFRPGKKGGESDVVVDVQDRFPVRLYAGYETSGTKLTGEDRLLYGATWGNAFGMGHQLGYENTVDTSFTKIGAHSGSYVAPLPWRHILSVYGSYVDVDVPVGGGLNAKGSNIALSGRYTIPLAPMSQYRHELTLGFDYKSGDNDLLFGGETVTKSQVDVAQFQCGYSGVLPDRWGQTAFALSGFYSPGGLTDHNGQSDFETLRLGTKPDYFYGRLMAERVTKLPWSFSWVLRATGQMTSGRLLPSELMGLGVRAYDNFAVSGDEGWYLNNELRTPSFSPLAHWLGAKTNQKVADQLQFLAFYDYGAASRIDAGKYFEKSNQTISSVGVGVAYNINPFLAVRCDYGWKVEKVTGDTTADSRGHISVIIGY